MSVKLKTVQLRQSSDPNAVGTMSSSLASCMLRAEGPLKNVESIELYGPEGNWLLINGVRIVPRELVLHAEFTDGSAVTAKG